MNYIHQTWIHVHHLCFHSIKEDVWSGNILIHSMDMWVSRCVTVDRCHLVCGCIVIKLI
jgi:hypothetical protein